jgi:triacylglycerol lipase
VLKFITILLAAMTSASASNAQIPECVILLHGLGRTSASMILLANDLKRAGYQVINQSYPSRHQSIIDIANGLAPRFQQCASAPRIHVVTHSMGAIVLRQYLALHQHANLGRALLLGPPNQGSEVVDAGASVGGIDGSTAQPVLT